MADCDISRRQAECEAIRSMFSDACEVDSAALGNLDAGDDVSVAITMHVQSEATQHVIDCTFILPTGYPSTVACSLELSSRTLSREVVAGIDSQMRQLIESHRLEGTEAVFAILTALQESLASGAAAAEMVHTEAAVTLATATAAAVVAPAAASSGVEIPATARADPERSASKVRGNVDSHKPAATNGAALERTPLILDLETSDPDDVWNLLLIAGHPLTDLKGVTIVPGTPAQLLLVHNVLELLATSYPDSLGYLKQVPIGYYDIDDAIRKKGETKFWSCEEHATRDLGEEVVFHKAGGGHYKDLFPAWQKFLEPFCQIQDKSNKEKVRGGPKKKSKGSVGSSLSSESDEPVGATDAGKKLHEKVKSQVSQYLREHGRDVMEGGRLLMQVCNEETTLMTGGPVSNLGKAIDISTKMIEEGTGNPLRLRRWFAQGGFAGANVVPEEVISRMEGRKEWKWHEGSESQKRSDTNPAWNFDLDHEAAVAALAYEGINERWIAGKNVCHRVLLGSVMPLQFLEKAEEEVSSSEVNQKFPSSLGLKFLLKSLRGFRHDADGKKLHDLVQGLSAIHPGLAGVVWRKVQFRAVPKGPKTESIPGRWKNGIEWGCETHIVGEPFVVTMDNGVQWVQGEPWDGQEFQEGLNANIAVDLDLDGFLNGLVGHEMAARARQIRASCVGVE